MKLKAEKTIQHEMTKTFKVRSWMMLSFQRQRLRLKDYDKLRLFDENSPKHNLSAPHY